MQPVTNQSGSFPQAQQSTGAYVLCALALLATIALTIFSWMRVCSEGCAESHNYRLFGFSFEQVGIILFPLLTICHLLSRRYPILSLFTGWMLCAALGSELMFLYIQQAHIKSWCPVCLSIALALTIAGLTYFYSYYINFKKVLKSKERGLIMNNIFKGLAGSIAFIVGFILAFSGIVKNGELHAEEINVQQQIAFGDVNSPIDVYIFTDWECPGCRALEPVIKKMTPNVSQKAKLTFVDDPVHPGTLNFTPYNVSFMINNKPQYFSLREELTKLSEKTKEPKDAQVEKFAAKQGTRYVKLKYGDVALATKYFDHLIKHFKVEGTPTVVIFNKTTDKSQSLQGSEITEESVLKAIDTLSKGIKVEKEETKEIQEKE